MFFLKIISAEKKNRQLEDPSLEKEVCLVLFEQWRKADSVYCNKFSVRIYPLYETATTLFATEHFKKDDEELGAERPHHLIFEDDLNEQLSAWLAKRISRGYRFI